MQVEENPFEFGFEAQGDFPADTVQEMPKVRQLLAGRNHLALVSPRRFGKTGLVRKAVMETGRPAVFVNLQMATTEAELAAMLLKAFLGIHPVGRFRADFKRFRAKPVLTYNIDTNAMEVSFDACVKGSAALEDVLNVMDAHSDSDNRLIVVLDGCEEIPGLEPGTDKLLRAVMEKHANINYVFIGSDEGAAALFEDDRTAFFHFGVLMRLSKIPHDAFSRFLVEKLKPIRGDKARDDAAEILELAKGHALFVQQLVTVFREHCRLEGECATVQGAGEALLRSLSASYEVLWSRLNRTNRRILSVLARGGSLQDIGELSTSTVYGAVGRMRKDGLIVRDEEFALEDPFFELWIRRSIEQAATGVPGSP